MKRNSNPIENDWSSSKWLGLNISNWKLFWHETSSTVWNDREYEWMKRVKGKAWETYLLYKSIRHSRWVRALTAAGDAVSRKLAYFLRALSPWRIPYNQSFTGGLKKSFFKPKLAKLDNCNSNTALHKRWHSSINQCTCQWIRYKVKFVAVDTGND